MRGRLEHDMELEASTQKILDRLPRFVEEWNLNLKAGQKTASTRYDYVHKIAHFLRYINEDVMYVSPEDMDFMTTQNFFVSIQTKEVNGEIIETSDSHRCTYWCVLNSFFKYLIKRKLMIDNPMDGIDKPQNHDLERINQHRIYMTDYDFKLILDAIEKDDNYEYDIRSRFPYEVRLRNKLLLMILMTTGMRKTALSEINIEDIASDGKLTIIDKRKKEHTYSLKPSVIECLNEWLINRQNMLNELNTYSDALFITVFGKRMGGKAINNVVNRYSEKGIGRKLSAHKLRAGCATILYQKTNDIEFVRRAIGHSNVATTQRYIVSNGSEREKASELLTNIFANI